MAKKKSQFSDDELYETTSDEQITGEPVDSSVNPNGITIDNPTEELDNYTYYLPVELLKRESSGN